MQHAEPQVSRAYPQSAIFAQKAPSAWAFSCPHTSDHPTPTTTRRVYRRAVLEEVIAPRLHTERGQATFTRRWYGLPDGLDDDQVASALLAELERDDEAIADITSWADQHVPARPGRSLPLPAPPPTTKRWQSATLWVAGALFDESVTTHPRVQRIGQQHLRVLLQAIASFADWATGRHVTASNVTIGKKAASLCSEHITQGRAWSGRRTDRLSPITLAGHVSALTTALEDAGWLVERARGRHLTRLERSVAWIRHHLHQDRAGSVRDLVVPQRAWVTEHKTPAKPAWADPANPFCAQQLAAKLGKALFTFRSHRALHTHPYVVRLTFIVTLIYGYLTEKTRRDTSPAKRKKNAARSSPSLAAQKLAARLCVPMPWLLRGAATGKKRHIHSLARILDDLDLTGLTAKTVLSRIEIELRERHWELHPSTIRHPLAWVRSVLHDHWGKPD